MTTFNVQVRAIRRGDLVDIYIGDYKTTLYYSEVDTEAKFALWYLNQVIVTNPDEATLRRAFAIEGHQNAEGGWVLDNVSSQALKEDTAAADFATLPNWATWTAQQADDWIVANVTSLATALPVIRQMARFLIYLRDYVRLV